jgi:amino acid transporter
MLLVGIGGAIVIMGLNLLGAQLAVVSHTLLTYSFFAVVVCILLTLLSNGDVHNATPLFGTTNGRPWWVGSGAIFAFCAYALNGFQTIPHAVEERSGAISLRAIGLIIVGSIAAAAGFYCLVVIAASVIVPWRELVTAPLPMLAAVRQLPHGEWFVMALLIATAASLLKAWNGVFMMAVRLLVAMARAGCVPAAFARLHPRLQSPAPAVLAVGACNIAGIFLGKEAIEPITDMSAMVLTLTYALCCWTVLHLRRRGTTAYVQVAHGALVWIALAGSALMAACAFITPFWQQDGLPLEWRLLGVWGLMGVAVWRYAVRRAAVEPDRLSQPSDPDSPSIRGPL